MSYFDNTCGKIKVSHFILPKIIVTGAKSRDVKGADDATAKLGDL